MEEAPPGGACLGCGAAPQQNNRRAPPVLL